MRAPGLYRAAIRCLPHQKVRLRALAGAASREKGKALEAVLNRHRALGGALVFFDRDGVSGLFVYGEARRGVPVDAKTAFRLASVSKLVTAAGVMKMAEAGRLDIDADADRGLPYSLRHPGAPGTPVTLRMLLTHTAGIHDGKAYLKGLTAGASASDLLQKDSHTRHLPGGGCEYSNFGVGLAACVVEAQTGLSFETAMRETLFRPLNMKASYYPACLDTLLADARRVLPPARKPAFDAASRQARPAQGWESPDPERHWKLAHGSCCMDAGSAALLGRALLEPGFLTLDSLETMRIPRAELGARDPTMSQGVGMFILRDKTISPAPLYGHQGMAYGAVHMLFLDLEKGRGILSLTAGVSEARHYILADVNRELLKEWIRDE